MNQISNRFDNYSNLLSGLGIPSLDRTSTTFWNNQRNQGGFSRYWHHQYSMYDLAEFYTAKGLAAKIIDRPSDDAFQRGVEIEGDDDDVMTDEYDRLSVMSVMANAVRWSRLYGGSAILLVAKDGGDFNEPLNFDNIEMIEELRVLDVTCIKRTDRYYTDPLLSNYGQLEYYTITPPGAQSFEVHETRLIPVAGEPLPNTYYRQLLLPWIGKSILEPCINSISRYEQALEWSLRLLERKQQGIYNMNGLNEAISGGYEQMAAKRINLVDQVRSNLNSIVVDKDDTYTILNLGLDGIETLLIEYQVAVSADSNMPITVLFGKSTTGLNASGAGDLETYYGMVQHIQTSIAYPVLEKLTSILWLQSSMKSKIPDKWHVEFNPLWVPSEQEQANTDNLNSQANANNINALITLMNNGILDPEEVRKIVINTKQYAEFDFPDTLPSSGEDINYAETVDMQNMVDGESQQSNRSNA